MKQITSKTLYGPYLLVLPGAILIGIFLIWPICYGIWLSLYNFDGMNISGEASLANYIAVLMDKDFQNALSNTTIFAVITVVGKNVLGIALALLASIKLPGMKSAQLLLFLPVTLNIVVIGAFWTYFLGSSQFGGLLNSGLEAIGLSQYAKSWLSTPGIALIVLAFIEVWRWAGLHMLLFLAGLQSIDPTLYEAARLDGAGKWARFRHITLPALLPIIGASTIFALIGAYVRSFDVVWVLTRAGFDTEVIATFIYREAFTYGRFDKAIAAGLILTIFLSAIFLITRLIKPKGGQNE